MELSESMKLTGELVKIDSSDPGAYEGKIAAYVLDWLREHVPDAQLETQEVLPGRFNIRAVLQGKKPHPSLAFICHMDTVVPGEGWKTAEPLSALIKDGRLYGRGACDMKSGLACALTAFAKAGDLAKGRSLTHTLQFIATVDEEDFMRGAEAAIKSGWVTGQDWILDTEPTDGQIRAAHKGRTWMELRVKGVTAHASTPEKGADAIAGMAEIISRIRKEVEALPVHEQLGKTTVTFGMIRGGYRPYVVPDAATVWIDYRLVPPTDAGTIVEIAKKAMNAAREHFPGIRAEYEITGDRPYVEQDDSSKLLRELARAHERVCEKPAKTGVFPGYTDTAVISGRLHNHNCMSYGPGNLELAHKPDEYVPLEDIERCTKVLEELVKTMVFPNGEVGETES